VLRPSGAIDGSQACDAPSQGWNGSAAAGIAHLRSRNAELESQLSGLVEANRGLRRFVTEAAHELMEPLVLVESAALQCKADVGLPDATDDLKMRLDVIGSVAAQGRLLVDSLLHDARSAERSPQLKRLDLQHTVADALGLVDEGAAARRLRIRVGSMPTLVSNPELLSIVVRNLLVNAVKYSSVHAGDITITAERDRSAWKLSVFSPGRAVPPDDVDRILRRFERADSRRARGVGLGLAICVRIVERLGGTLGVAPEPGVGNRFFVLLPDLAEPA
jgi:signal transduction histidine kinase